MLDPNRMLARPGLTRTGALRDLQVHNADQEEPWRSLEGLLEVGEIVGKVRQIIVLEPKQGC